MARKRYFAVEGLSPGRRTIVVAGDEYHHLVHVLRARTGTAITVMNGSGGIYEATVERIGRGEAVLRLRSYEQTGEPPPVDMALPLTKAHRLDVAVEKCTEIGVRRFIPFIAERGVWRGDEAEGEQKRERLLRKVIAACKQSGRSHFPSIGELRNFAGLVASFGDYARICLADPGGSRFLARAPLPPDGAVLGIVGPEGGLTARERSTALEAGAETVSLGSASLRSETAAICLLFRLHDLFAEEAEPRARR
jgi:16S rRNA (uracil1498-N3)-methyltransferase